MHDVHTYSWWINRRDSPRWQSPIVALLVTAAVFTAALASMTRPGESFDASRVMEDQPRLVFFPPRVEAAPKVVDRPRPMDRAKQPVESHRPLAPTAPIAVPTSPPAVETKRDSATVPNASAEAIESLRRLAPSRDLPAPSAAPSIARGAPIAPAGVAIGSAPLTPAQRDSIVKGRIAAAVSAAELGSHGNAHGIGGQQAGTLSAGVSIPFPLFSSGPSAAERKRNAAIDADNRLRLHRLQAVVAQRDSVRADSLRRDSLAQRAIRP